MNQYTLYCTEAQTKKALELGAPIEMQTSSTLIDTLCAFCGDGMYVIPTAEQMIGWLEEQGLLISILYGYEVSNKWAVDIDSEEYIDYKSGEFSSRKEATLAAIDAALEYLTNNKK